MPRGGQTDWTDADIRLLELIDEVEAEKNALVDLRREIMAAIAGVADERYRELLEYRYVNGWTWQRVAEEMNYSKRQIYRLHEKAVEAIEGNPRAQMREEDYF